jgi:hypothetical protein
MIKNINDGSKNEPRLHKILNRGTIMQLPDWSSIPKLEDKDLYAAIKDYGYEGFQGGDPALCSEFGLTSSGSFRGNKPEEIEKLVKEKKGMGYDALTCHLGWGMEDDSQVDTLVQTVIKHSEKYEIPIFIETHRATITQDIWRTVEMVKRNPEIRFNGDFSHWYTGLEMPYGSFEDKCDFLEPVFKRVRFFHGRMGNSSHMQMKFDKGSEFVADFEQLWVRSMKGFLETAQPGDYLPFAPELLPGNYARKFIYDGKEEREESDRWQQALTMIEIAESCFNEAKKQLASDKGEG